MPQARFAMDFDSDAGRPALPTDDEHGYTVTGWVTCSYTPAATCVVLVSALRGVIDAMIEHEDFDWLGGTYASGPVKVTRAEALRQRLEDAGAIDEGGALAVAISSAITDGALSDAVLAAHVGNNVSASMMRAARLGGQNLPTGTVAKFDLKNDGQDQADIDSAIDLVYAAREDYASTADENPVLDISGTSAAPSAAALTKIDDLVENYGWTVIRTSS
jgi:hypothetical protein